VPITQQQADRIAELVAGRENAISQQAIAERVFDRDDDFDPTTDPIVRMQAGRVRRSLERYYLKAGAVDTVLIDLPKGCYVPVFTFRTPSVAFSRTTPEPAADSWPTLLVSPLRNLTGLEDVEFIADGLTCDLASELSRYAALHVFLGTCALPEQTTDYATRFEIGGAIGLHKGDLRLNIRLIDTQSGRLLWARAYQCPHAPTHTGRLQEAIEETAATIAEENGLVTNRLLKEAGKRPGLTGDAYDAILRHHYYERTQSAEAFAQALQALRKAVATHPDCALCWSYLSRLSAIHWSLGLPGDTIPVSEALAAARCGVAIDPASIPARRALSYVQILHDELGPARAGIETALRMNGESIFWLDGIGYLLTLAGDFEQGPELIRRAMRVNPYHRPVCHAALWLDALRRNDPDVALAEARAFSPSAIFWSPFMEAVSLVAGDRVGEAAAPVARLLEIKPDFPAHAHWLITRYIKFPPLVKKIETALSKAGLSLT
jgi:TolB-like protein